MVTNEQERCKVKVYRRDTLRYTGRVKGGFEMHYAGGQCERRAVEDGRCWQHKDQPWLMEVSIPLPLLENKI